MIVAVIDSCIIFGMPLCDTFLRAAEQNLYRIILSQKILEDAARNMVIKGRLKPDREQYYQQQILNAFPDCFVEAPPKLTESMTNASSDRHVAATAIASNASYIVTFNLKDFPKTSLPNYDLDAIHLDLFLELLCDRWGDERLYRLICQQSNALRNPPISPKLLLNKLARQQCDRFRSRLIKFTDKRNF
jgi:Asp-tRNA(Asn)/Glu-tRNA(Gln) amidotransferase A subunit family amidase